MTAPTRTTLRTLAALGLADAMITSLVPAASTASDPPAPAPTAEPLTNVAHLDFPGDAATPLALADHTTYQLEQQPDLGVP